MIAASAHLVVLVQLLHVSAISVERAERAETAERAGRAERAEAKVSRTTHFTSTEENSVKREGSLKVQTKHKLGLGVMNRRGVTQYSGHSIKRAKRTDGRFFWPDSGNRQSFNFTGAADLTDNISWGWHHPAGIYNTIPVGSPLIDGELNIYIGSDDAVRKFDITGQILWSYAPRGQLAAAITLVTSSSRREAARVSDEMSEEAEDMLRPDWDKNSTSNSFKFFKDFKIGDVVKVKPGLSYRADGREVYRDGDQGMISEFVPGENRDSRAVILWTRTGHKSVVDTHAMKNRFVRVQQTLGAESLPPMIVGSTTSGYVFAIAMDSGEELWATWASNTIAGVKGAVAAKDGVVVVATDMCTDRYCYRYRNLTVPLWHGNSKVRGVSAADGSAIWEYKTMSPVWNMVPLWGPNSDVMFQDYEGRLYCLDLQTGALKYRVGGNIGTQTQAAATYDPGNDMVVALGVGYYADKYCNPYIAPGILINCNTWPGVNGWVRGYNASSGHKLWEVNTPEPPASGAVGSMNSWAPGGHTRLVVTMGFNCRLNSPSQIWAIDPNNGHIRWKRDGPTLWTNHCAGDREGADIRRVMGGRESCSPNSWSVPVIDSNGDVYVGNQVGMLQKWGTPTGMTRDIQVLSTLNTGHAFQDAAIAFANGVMAVTTCTSLIVLQTNYTEYFTSETWSVTAPPNVDGEPYGYSSPVAPLPGA